MKERNNRDMMIVATKYLQLEILNVNRSTRSQLDQIHLELSNARTGKREDRQL